MNNIKNKISVWAVFACLMVPSTASWGQEATSSAVRTSDEEEVIEIGRAHV